MLAVIAPLSNASASPAAGQAGDFDFYVLSLSWSPTYCASPRADPDQCDLDLPGFVLHGLWPQYEIGYPEYCDAEAPSRVARSVLSEVSDVMPDAGLAHSQWQKHGSCSGLEQHDYFALMEKAYRSVTIPDDLQAPGSDGRRSPKAIEEAFVEANPGLLTEGVAVRCPENRLSEVRVCLDKALRFRSCAEVDRNSCRAATIMVPAAD